MTGRPRRSAYASRRLGRPAFVFLVENQFVPQSGCGTPIERSRVLLERVVPAMGHYVPQVAALSDYGRLRIRISQAKDRSALGLLTLFSPLSSAARGLRYQVGCEPRTQVRSPDAADCRRTRSSALARFGLRTCDSHRRVTPGPLEKGP